MPALVVEVEYHHRKAAFRIEEIKVFCIRDSNFEAATSAWTASQMLGIRGVELEGRRRRALLSSCAVADPRVLFVGFIRLSCLLGKEAQKPNPRLNPDQRPKTPNLQHVQ